MITKKAIPILFAIILILTLVRLGSEAASAQTFPQIEKPLAAVMLEDESVVVVVYTGNGNLAVKRVEKYSSHTLETFALPTQISPEIVVAAYGNSLYIAYYDVVKWVQLPLKTASPVALGVSVTLPIVIR